VPLPTHIKLETDIGFFSNKVPSALQLGSIRNEIIQKVPKINFMFYEIRMQSPDIMDISKSLGKAAHELVFPKTEKKLRFRAFKTMLLDKLQQTFRKDNKASQVISQIRKTYDI
jgi:hypothetical protein